MGYASFDFLLALRYRAFFYYRQIPSTVKRQPNIPIHLFKPKNNWTLVLTASDLGPAWLRKRGINSNEGVTEDTLLRCRKGAYARLFIANFMVVLWTFFVYISAGGKRESS